MPSNFTPKDAANPYADYDAVKLEAFLAGYELPRDPGAAYQYSNLGFGLLGYALEQLEHTTYGALTDEEKVLSSGCGRATRLRTRRGRKSCCGGFAPKRARHAG